MATVDPIAPAAATHAQEPDGSWNGVERCYHPAEPLRLDGDVRLHRATGRPVDPITYEVIRYALQTANFEHSDLIQRLTVSPATMLGRDLQASMLLEDGAPLFFGADVAYFSVAGSISAKWILENRGRNPGIAPGDVFFSNDPFISSPHQQDAIVSAPLFVDGEIFCWVVNCLHYTDLGGISPGSFCVAAEDIWSEPSPMPPFKIVEAGQVREDLVAVFKRQSRIPTAVEADLRAALAASRATVDKVAALVERYGAETVKNAMVRTVEASEKTFVERLKDIPDGAWSHRSYCEAARPGDTNSYCFQVNITKRGEHLTIDNHGSSPQAGSLNAPYNAFQGACIAALSSQIIPDLGGAFGGVHRRISFRPVSGTVCTPEWPAAMSTSGAYANFTLVAAATAAVAKMLMSGNEASRMRSVGLSVPHAYVVVGNGNDRTGNFFLLAHLDFHIGSPGGMAQRDGPDAGGHYWVPGTVAMNVEEAERQYPILHLYRRFLDLGADGAGAHRGGLGGRTGAIPWKAMRLAIDLQLNESYPKSGGQAGGNPGSKASFRVFRGARIEERFRQGGVPQQLDALGAERVDPSFKDSRIPIDADDAYEFVWPTASGHGDVLLRDPNRVLDDQRGGLLSVAEAESVYGVAIDDEHVDEARTADIRRKRRRERLAAATVPFPLPAAREPLAGDWQGVKVVRADAGARFACHACDQDFGAADENYKDRLPLIEQPIARLAEAFATTDPQTAGLMVHREFLCPACGSRCETEIARAGDSILWDRRIG